MRRALIYILISSFMTLICMASSPLDKRRIRHYTVDNGLASNAIYSFHQDSKGRIWLGTVDGLHSFDGYTFREWRDNSISSLGSAISSITEDDKNQLWIGTSRGIVIFDLLKEEFKELDIAPSSGVRIKSLVYDIIFDSNKQAWIATGGEGVFRYDPTTKILRQYPAITKVNSDAVRDIMEDSSGFLWIATQKGLSRYNPIQDRFIPVGNSKIDALSLFEDGKHNIWIGSRDNGLFMLDRTNDQLVHKLSPNSLHSVIMIRDITEWEPEQLLMVSDLGLISYDIETDEVSITKADNNGADNRLNDNYLQSIFIDNEGALWIGTYFGGVNYVSPYQRLFSHYYKGNTDLGAKVISVFAKADDNNLWLGSDDAGVFLWDRNDNTFKSICHHPLLEGSAHRNIHAILQDGDSLFVGMYLGGLNIIDLKTSNVKNYKLGESSFSLYSSSIYSIFKDSYGDIWVGTTAGLNRYRRQTDDFERIFEVHPADVVFMMEDKRGFLWACTNDQGIYRLDRKTEKWQQFSADDNNDLNGLPTNAVVTAACDDEGKMWFGTDGFGLLSFDYDSQKFTRIDLPEKIRVINKIIPYGKMLWLATTKGLFCYEPKSGVIHPYDKDFGLQDNVFLPNSGLMTSDRQIVMGGINGFNEFNPSNMTHETLKPEVILSDFQIFNNPVEIGEDSPLKESIAYSKGITLNHNERMVSFKVAPLSYINPSQNRYLYKLEGFDKTWNEAYPGYPHTYTNLPAGEYHFKVSTYNGNGGWNEDAFDFTIKVLPPWWWSTPMILIYLLAIAAGVWYGYHIIISKQQEKLAKLSDQKDRELYRSKIAFFTHIVHEIRTPLTLILSPLESLAHSDGDISNSRKNIDIMERNGKRLLSLVNRLMDFRKIESDDMKINPESIDLRQPLHYICDEFVVSAGLKDLDISISIPDYPCVAIVDREAFRQIVDNLLSNAMKFSKSQIRISLSKDDDGNILLSVKDDGPGIPVDEQEKIFTPFYQVEENRPSDNIGTGLGLLIVKRYATLLNAVVKLDSMPGKGADFTIIFPTTDQVPEEDADEDMRQQSSEEMQEQPEQTSPKRDQLLIVDDNSDMLSYLNDLLCEDFDVVCASNAEEGLKKLDEIEPSLIISDIMMPGIDGVEFCRRIKHNLNTSHIPVILLTAKVEDSDFVVGLDNGADLYVTKPFSPNVIKAQIRSLLSNRNLLRQRFKTDPSKIQEFIPGSSLDKEFFNRINEIITQRMADPDFSVDMLAKDAAISRTGLFTKLKAIAGMTPNEYIRQIRLQKAAELLASHTLQISEVCWQVGFSSRSHFAKSFQLKYGMTPTEYRNRQK